MTSFTQEELARLVQFITGSSQLPPGGFAELSPPIQISSAPTTNALPTAHTWWVKYRIFRVFVNEDFKERMYYLKNSSLAVGGKEKYCGTRL